MPEYKENSLFNDDTEFKDQENDINKDEANHDDGPVIMVTPEMYKEMNALQEISVDNIVPISSQIVNKAKMNLSLNAQRILRVVYSIIKPTDLPGRTYRFNLSDFAEVFGMSTTKIHSNINQACVELRNTFTLPIGKGRVTGLISHAQINDNEVQINLDPALLAIYKKELDTKYYLKCIKELAYSQSFKFYELFMLKLGGNDQVTFSIDVDELKEWLQISDKYSTYADFKRRILVPTIDDINGNKTNAKSRVVENNMCNIRVSFEEYKEYRKVVSIVFSVTRLKEREVDDIVVDDFYSSLTQEGQDGYNWLRDIVKVSHSAIVHCVKLYGEDNFIRIYHYLGEVLNDSERGSNIKRPAAFAATCLRKGLFNDILPSSGNEFEKIASGRENILAKLSELNITDKSVLVNILKFSDEHISANIDYCMRKYGQDKNSNEIASLIVVSIPKDYAGYETKKALMEEEAKIIKHKQELKKLFETMSDSELEAYEGDGMEAAKEELNRRIEQRKLDEEAMLEIEFNEFMENGSFEEKDFFRKIAIEQISDFIRSHTCKTLNTNDLDSVPLEKLMTAMGFRTVFKNIWKEEHKNSGKI